jgi:hypothetical protein
MVASTAATPPIEAGSCCPQGSTTADSGIGRIKKKVTG